MEAAFKNAWAGLRAVSSDCTRWVLEAALSTQGVTGLLSCPGDPALFPTHFVAAREQSWLRRRESPFLGAVGAGPAADP